DSCGSSWVHFPGAVDDSSGDLAVGALAGVAALEVVVDQVALEVLAQGGEFGHQGAGEGGSPAFLEDGALHPLHGSVGLGSAGANEAMLCAVLLDRLGEGRGPKLGAVVGRDGAE